MPHRSIWLDVALSPDEPALLPLEGAARADVAIMGGGYAGLWTAIRIKQREPSCDVVVLEQDICGGGASGRNGGFALTEWAKLGTLAQVCGRDRVLEVAQQFEDAVDELGAFCEEHGIDAHYHRGGHLWTATSQAQLGAWDGVMRTCRELGVMPFEEWSPEETARRTGSDRHLAGLFEPTAAILQPALLVRGLRRVALELGVRIHEGTRVTRLDRRAPAVLHTPRGVVTADRVVVATNAWAVGLRELHMRLAVISSDIVATAPMPDRLREIGWTDHECISDSKLQISYYRTTDDGRIVYGKGGWGIALHDRIGPRFDRDEGRARDVTRSFHEIYPMLADVPIAADWCGPIDRTRSGLPIFGHLGGREHIVYGVGFSGNGVAPCVVGGKILASLALGSADEWSSSPLVDGVQGRFPPEPVRFLGAHIVREGVARKEYAETNGRTPSRLAVALAGLAPAGMIPKKDE
jgi:putative aminophosphonate oxidoreductase